MGLGYSRIDEPAAAVECFGSLPDASSVLKLGCPRHRKLPEIPADHEKTTPRAACEGLAASGAGSAACGCRAMPVPEEEEWMVADVVAENCETCTPPRRHSLNDWGFFYAHEEEDVGFRTSSFADSRASRFSTLRRSVSLEPSAVEATPAYVLEGSLDSQVLWHITAGRRPKQPEEERRAWERIWEEQLRISEGMVIEVAKSARSPRPRRHSRHRHCVYMACPHAFAATKSFTCPSKGCCNIACVMLHIPKIRIVYQGGRALHAEYLILVDNGGQRYGVWRRYSDFKTLRQRLSDTPSAGRHKFEKSCRHWERLTGCLKWYRCLDAAYLKDKGFLLERFMHQVLADSREPTVLRDFIFGDCRPQ